MNFYSVKLEKGSLIFTDGNKISLPKDIAGNLKSHPDNLIMDIRGEDIKFDDQNIDLYNDNNQKAGA